MFYESSILRVFPKHLEILWLMRPYGHEDNAFKIVDILKEFSQDSKCAKRYIVAR
jgi:hypothetical protein